MPKNTRKIQKGLYEHTPSGRLIVHNVGVFSGPRGGAHDPWEHAKWSTHYPGTWEIDGSIGYNTLREAAEALDDGINLD